MQPFQVSHRMMCVRLKNEWTTYTTLERTALSKHGMAYRGRPQWPQSFHSSPISRKLRTWRRETGSQDTNTKKVRVMRTANVVLDVIRKRSIKGIHLDE